MALDLYHPGLHGVIAGETNISSLDHGLIYRGYCIHDLAEESNFLEVCYLLLHEELRAKKNWPTFAAFSSRRWNSRSRSPRSWRTCRCM